MIDIYDKIADYTNMNENYDIYNKLWQTYNLDYTNVRLSNITNIHIVTVMAEEYALQNNKYDDIAILSKFTI